MLGFSAYGLEECSRLFVSEGILAVCGYSGDMHSVLLATSKTSTWSNILLQSVITGSFDIRDNGINGFRNA